MAIDREARKAAKEQWRKDIKKQEQAYPITNIRAVKKGKKDKRTTGCAVTAITVGTAVVGAVATWKGMS